MFDLLTGGFGIAGLIIFSLLCVIGLALVILWFMLPFAVFGTKKKLDAIIAESQTATVVSAVFDARIDRFGHIVLERRP